MQTLLVKTYPASGRPDRFVLVEKKEVPRLVEGFQFSEMGEKPDDYTVSMAWAEYTYTDADNFTQWKG